MCSNRENPDSESVCLNCGTSLIINNRIQLIKPLRELNKDPFSYTEVFEVTDLGTEWNPGSKQRIMKVLKWSEPKLVELFERESLTLQLIHNQYIPKSTIDDFFTFIPSSHSITLRCLVMDKFEGLNLYEWVKANGKISQKLALEWLQQLIEILAIVHQSECFHRDIKPSNIICQPNGKLALIDFGASRRITDTYMTKLSVNNGTTTSIDTSKYEITVVNTPYYTPIEQINGKAIPQSDFYALGRTFIYLLTAIPLNKLPINKKTGKIIWRDKAPQINQIFANLIDELQAEIPIQRPQTTEIILERLSRFPLQSKIHQVISSKLSKFSVLILIFVVIFMVYKEARPWISRFYFDLASRNQENTKVAKKYYKLAIRYNPNDIDSYNNLALICQKMLDLNCVISSYNSALKLNPNSWSIHYNLGSFYDSQGHYDKAMQQYKLAMKKSDKTVAQPINSLSRLNNINGNYKVAESLALKGLNKTSSKNIKATLHKNLAWALLGQKRYFQAKSHLQKTLEIDPQRAEAYCLLAQVQEKSNLVSDARLSWEACLMLNSSLPEVQGWRQKILQRIL